MQITQSFCIQPRDVVAFVGGGGKSSAMFRLADELVAQGKRVITTTTTRLAVAQIEAPSSTPRRSAQNAVSLHYATSPDFATRVLAALEEHAYVLVVGEKIGDGKVAGVPPGFVDELAVLDAADAVIYEADGSRMLPFKAPAAHEPVVAVSTTLLVPVISATVFGAPLDDAHVHRAEIVARLAGARLGEPVMPVIAARVLVHPDGGLKNKPPTARAVALINQVEDDTQLDAARTLARLLLGYVEIDTVAIGAVHAENPIRETHRRVAAIVLAAGASTRMAGTIKQLLPWRGRTLIRNAIDIAVQSSANEVIVVLGAHAEEIRAVIRESSARIVINRQWEGGHSTSIRAGLNALSPKTTAAIFINADQPLLTSDVVSQIIQRYRETDASVIVPFYAGMRGSPVLFERAHFDELANLSGEQGGRELLIKYPVERVDFADTRLGMDVDTIEDYEKLT
jgi:molybdenum cofactor cytidylyltransferase